MLQYSRLVAHGEKCMWVGSQFWPSEKFYIRIGFVLKNPSLTVHHFLDSYLDVYKGIRILIKLLLPQKSFGMKGIVVPSFDSLSLSYSKDYSLRDPEKQDRQEHLHMFQSQDNEYPPNSRIS